MAGMVSEASAMLSCSGFSVIPDLHVGADCRNPRRLPQFSAVLKNVAGMRRMSYTPSRLPFAADSHIGAGQGRFGLDLYSVSCTLGAPMFDHEHRERR